MTSPEGDRGPGSRAVGFGLGGSAAVPGGPSAANGSESYMNGSGPAAKASDPAPAAPQASTGTPGSAPQGGGSTARAVQAPAVKDSLGPNDKAPSVPAPASKAPAEPAEAAAKEAPAPEVKESPAPPKESPVAKEAPAPVAEPAPPVKAPAPAPRASSSSSSGGSSSGTATKTATRPERGEAPAPKSKLGRTRGTAGVVPPPRVRRARLKIANIDPWSVMKVSFLFSVALGVILLVAVTLLWALLDFMGFFTQVAGTIEDISKDSNGGGFDVVAFFSLPRVLGMTTIVALIDIILITALATLAAYLYNLSTDLVGGVEVTLAEEE